MKLAILILSALPLCAQWSSLGANTVLNNAKLSGSVLVDCAGSTPPAYCTGSGANYTFASFAHEVIDAWGGAAADTVNNRLIITGGGHVDYNGNQVYILDLNTNVMSIDIGPTGNYATGTGIESNSDGTPTSRHSYEGLVYLPNENAVFYWGNGNAPGGTRATNVWWYSLSTHSWTQKATQPDNTQDQVSCMIDPTQSTESLICLGLGSYIMWRYVPGTDTFTQLNALNGTSVPFESSCAIQPDQKIMICVGANSFGASAGIYSIDITGAASYAAVNITSSTTGCSALYSVNFPGLDYDSSTGLLVYYSGTGNSVVTFDVASGVCQTKTFSGGPTASGTTQGMLSKWAYFPKLNRHVAVNNAAAASFTVQLHPNGLGHSVVTSSGPCLDVDGDGYGVGAGCTGPDADDNDASVHTASDVITKYGSLDLFLQHIGVQNGSSPLTVYCIATTGNDSTGTASTTAQTACTLPYLTWTKVATVTGANPTQNYIVLYRGGTYTSNIGDNGGSGSDAVSGTPAVQNVIMAYPGELPVIDVSAGTTNGVWMAVASYITVDGFRIKANANGAGYFGGTFILYNSGSQTITFVGNILKHCDISGGGNDSNVDADNSLDFDVEENVFHDPNTSDGQHNVYLGSNTVPSIGITVSRNIHYNVLAGAGYPSLQWNGRMLNSRMEQNLGYNLDGQAIAWLNGVSNSFLRNNLSFNIGINAGGTNRIFTITNYDPGACPGAQCNCRVNGSPSICPWDQTNNVIANNSGWVGTQAIDGSGTLPTSYSVIVYNGTMSSTLCGTGSTGPCGNIGGQTWLNNAIVDLSGNNTDTPIYYDPRNATNYLALDTWTDNIIQNSTGSATLVATEGGTAMTCSAFNSAALAGSGCQSANPLFVNASTSNWNSPQSFNFALQPGSPALGVGVASASVPAVDIWGTARSSTAPSLGAIEQAGTSTSGGSVISGATKISGAAVVH
jgi:hypothetical protein